MSATDKQMTTPAEPGWKIALFWSERDLLELVELPDKEKGCWAMVCPDGRVAGTDASLEEWCAEQQKRLKAAA